MKKSEVISIDSNVHYSRYSVKESVLGCKSPKKHPAFSHSFQFKKEEVVGLIARDILRCDGLPFASRPAKISHRYWNPQLSKWINNHYHPVKISKEGCKDTYWALRLCQ